MKKLIGLFILVAMLTSCGEFHKVLKNDDVEAKYKLALENYEKGKETGKKSNFKRAIRLLEQIVPQYRSKPEGEALQYAFADSHFELEDYMMAGYQFERYTKSYSSSDKTEKAAYKGAKSYYYASPRYSLDQIDTHTALAKLQAYISEYPSGDYVGEANEIVSELNKKLEKKEFKIAQLYYHQDDYPAAVKSMETFIAENPGSKYREKAYFYKLDAEYTYAINSVESVREERLKKTQKYSEDYLKNFPEGKYLEDTKTISEDVEQRLKEF